MASGLQAAGKGWPVGAMATTRQSDFIFSVRAEQSVEKETQDTEGGRVRMKGAQAQRRPTNPVSGAAQVPGARRGSQVCVSG